MPGKAVGRAAVDLPWLCPNTDSLIGLAECPADLPRLSAADPALLAFLVRFGGYGPGYALNPAPVPHRFLSPILPETAAAYLAATPTGWLDPASKVVTTANRTAAAAAAFAHRIASHTRRADPDAAGTAARLSPLGWYAAAAVDPTEACTCLRDPAFAADPAASQRYWWGLEHAAIVRRLVARWQFPPWLGTLLGSLNLPLEAARVTVADPDLFAIVQLAVLEAQARTTDLGLTRAADRSALLNELRLTPETAEGLFAQPIPAAEPVRSSGLDPNPQRVLLVQNLLRLAGEARRRNGASLVVRLEDRMDELHRAAADLAMLVGDRIRDAKLAGLAELAAGAGHEINNPLAVISGHAQRLLRTEPDPERGDALRSIVRQSQRISGILRDLMQFARPPRPDPQRLPASELMTAVRADLTPFAEERGVRLELANAPADVWVEADPKHLRHALTAVARNGIEAAPRGGWVRIGCGVSDREVWFAVEDSGSGLTDEAAEHAFDPFFCGRSAGRGRGLGLSTAWRLARQNGGDVRFEPTPGGPTRFVVSLPVPSRQTEQPGRKSA